MSKYIDRGFLLQKLSRIINYCNKDSKVNAVTALFQVGDAIMDCPIADVMPIKYGRWEFAGDGIVECSECGETISSVLRLPQNYCPNCGCRMGGGDNEID